MDCRVLYDGTGAKTVTLQGDPASFTHLLTCLDTGDSDEQYRWRAAFGPVAKYQSSDSMDYTIPSVASDGFIWSSSNGGNGSSLIRLSGVSLTVDPNTAAVGAKIYKVFGINL